MREGWTYKKLGAITQQITGLWTGKKPPYTTIPVISLSCFTKDCRLNYDKAPDIEIEERHLPSKQLQYGDIIIEKSGGSDTQPVGRPAFFTKKEGVFSFCTFTSVLRVNDPTVDCAYLHKFLLARYQQGATFSLQSKTTGIHNLNFKDYLAWDVIIPPLSTQQQIVSELELLSHVLDQKRQQLKEYDALAESIFYDMFGDPVENPKGWDVKSIKDIGTIERGAGISKKDFVDNGLPCIHYGQLHTTLGSITTEHLTCIPQDLLHKFKIAHTNDVIMALTSEDVEGSCKSTAWLGNYDVVVGSDAAILHHSENGVYISYYTKTQAFYNEKAKYANGFKVTHISAKEIEKIPIPIPPLSLQQSFAEKILAIENQKQLINNSIKETETFFQSRMDYWFNS